MNRVANIDLWVWLCIAAALLAMRLYPNFGPVLSHDSFQYLSAADNVLAGRIGYTTLIHYDVERSFGVLPAPLLTFPSGYPLAIAAVSLTGVSTKTAALLLSAVSTIVCIPLISWLGVQLGLSRTIRNVVIACFVFNGNVSGYGLAAMSEPLFMFLTLLGVAALVRARLDSRGQHYWIAAGLAFGAAYFVRYAGLFFILGLAFVLFRHILSHERLLARGHAISLAVAGAFALAGAARNMLLTGNWHGRDEMLVTNTITSVLAQSGQVINGLFLGVGTGSTAPGGTFIPKVLFSALLVVGIASLAWTRWRERSFVNKQHPPVSGVGVDLLLLSVTYVACMMYAGLTSAISYGAARNFLPLTPLFVLLFGLLLRFLLPNEEGAIGRRLPIAALAISFCCYAYLNLLLIRKTKVDQLAVVADHFNSGVEGAMATRAVLLSRIGPHGAILANNGQAVGYFLGRPTISTVGPTFSQVVWDEKTVRETVQRFHIAAVVITAPIPDRPSDSDIPSPFVGELARGNAPAWLKLVHRSGQVLTYVPMAANP